MNTSQLNVAIAIIKKDDPPQGQLKIKKLSDSLELAVVALFQSNLRPLGECFVKILY